MALLLCVHELFVSTQCVYGDAHPVLRRASIPLWLRRAITRISQLAVRQNFCLLGEMIWRIANPASDRTRGCSLITSIGRPLLKLENSFFVAFQLHGVKALEISPPRFLRFTTLGSLRAHCIILLLICCMWHISFLLIIPIRTEICCIGCICR